MTVYVTKKAEFSSAHRLNNPDLSPEENERIYSKCNNLHGHGHNYTLEVTICGEPDPVTGFLMDLKQLKELINSEIIEKVDHRHLNYDVPFLAGINPTVENLCIIFWKILEPKIPNGRLYEIKISESPRSCVSYRGE